MKTLNIDGYIIASDDKWLYDLFDIAAVSQLDVRAFLRDSGEEEIEIRINCFGGDVWIASEIYSDLRDYKGKSTATIVGLSASASTVLMLGCDKVIGSPTSQYMMHNAQSSANGDYRDMEEAAKMLKNVNDTIINAYEIKTGLGRSELAAIMDKTTWMTAQEAKGHGFIDEIALKEGESLSELQISAVMDVAGRVYAATNINTARMHEYAKKMTGLNENRGASQPVSDNQRQIFARIRNKILGGE